jgi:hypothetical protein
MACGSGVGRGDELSGRMVDVLVAGVSVCVGSGTTTTFFCGVTVDTCIFDTDSLAAHAGRSVLISTQMNILSFMDIFEYLQESN